MQPSTRSCHVEDFVVLGQRSWADDDKIIFEQGRCAMWHRVPAAGGARRTSRCRTEDDENGDHGLAELLPGCALPGARHAAGCQHRSVETTRVRIVSPLSTWKRRRFRSLVEEAPGSRPRYAPTGHIIYSARRSYSVRARSMSGSCSRPPEPRSLWARGSPMAERPARGSLVPPTSSVSR